VVNGEQCCFPFRFTFCEKRFVPMNALPHTPMHTEHTEAIGPSHTTIEDLLSPTPSRSELTRFAWFSWILTFVVLLFCDSESLAGGYLLNSASIAIPMTAAVFAAAYSRDRRSFVRWLGAIAFVPGLFVVGSGRHTISDALLPFAVISLGAPAVGGLLYAPMLLLMRSIRRRGVSRHRGREALVPGLYGVVVLAGIWHVTPDVFFDKGGCACEGPRLAPSTLFALVLTTTTVLTTVTLALIARGVLWEVRVRNLLRDALVGKLPDWQTRSVATDAVSPRLALDDLACTVGLARTISPDNHTPFRTTKLHDVDTMLVPARLRSVGVATVLNILLGLTALSLGAGILYEAVHASHV
jgi:hypothetical protein